MSEINPNASTVVTTKEPKAPRQRVKLEDRHITSDRIQSLVNRLAMYNALDPEITKLKEDLKTILLTEKVKYGDGTIAYAVLSDNPEPMIPCGPKVVAAIQRKGISFKKLAESEAIKFSKEKLAEFFSGAEIEDMCEKGEAPAPKMTIKAMPNTAPLSVKDALEKLAAGLQQTPVTTPTGQITTLPDPDQKTTTLKQKGGKKASAGV